MENLRQLYKDCLVAVADLYYYDFNSCQQLIMVRIMYKLKSWLLNYYNIECFIGLYGEKRLYEINVLWQLHESSEINHKYCAYLYDGSCPLNYIRYIMHRNIHTDITIDDVCECLDKYNFKNNSLFREVVTLYRNADDEYYLTLLEEFCTKIQEFTLENIYKNIKDKELFMITMFKYIDLKRIKQFVYMHESKIKFTQRMMDVFIDNMMADKYIWADLEHIHRIIIWFGNYDILMPYDELVCNKIFISMCTKRAQLMPKNICDVIAEFSDDDVSFLKFATDEGYTCDSRTIKLASKNGNIKCAKYMKKYMKKTDK